MRSSFSKTVTSWPRARELLRRGEPRGSRADDGARCPRPARRLARGQRRLEHRWRAMARSTSLMVTGAPSRFSTHEASHGAGQTRPVTSGKLLVACSDRAASRGHAPAIDVIVPLGDQVSERAAAVAERDAAVHAARRLLASASAPRARRSNSREVVHALARARAPAPCARPSFRKPRGLPMGHLLFEARAWKPAGRPGAPSAEGRRPAVSGGAPLLASSDAPVLARARPSRSARAHGCPARRAARRLDAAGALARAPRRARDDAARRRRPASGSSATMLRLQRAREAAPSSSST